jgi:hypothetical protein
MHPADEAIFTEIYPLIGEIEDRLDQHITLTLWANLARKLATRGHELQELQEVLAKEFEHQIAFNSANHRSH